ncbi:LamG domain-containing protein [Paenibacillus eucommiae]|uniref:LamG-like jellyroll fold domain-containing protein n=1 Tax=Paenibacillus eucommiae TaxID=1355755 RepID=A0ABS4IRA6_9BACL|nr:LamG domain-containing protein [Paenibacillus eucommiae]MBP1990099.1 hypothetical protein [Paenibacillus eucommiae]
MLVAHWSFDGNSQDAGGKHNGDLHNVQFVEGVDGRANGAAYFNGTSSVIKVRDHEDFHFADGDFSFAAWVKQEKHAHPSGDLISKFDEHLRKGFHLTVGGNSSGYSSVSDSRTVLFGIDNAVEGKFIDCGKPREDNTLIAGLVVYKGQLYASMADALTNEDACKVYRYEGEGRWTDVGRVGKDPRTRSVQAMIVHDGELYVGTGVWDWTKMYAALCGPTRLFRYVKDNEWEDCGMFGKGQTTISLASYQGKIYTGDDRGQCFSYDGKGKWEFCGQIGVGGHDDRLDSMTVWRDRLYGCTHSDVWLYEGGRTWKRISQQPLMQNQLHKIHVHRGELLVGTWPDGKIIRYLGGEDWEDLGETGIDSDYKINEVNDLMVYNGKLYAGVIPKSQVFRYDGIYNWKEMAQLVDNKDWDVYDIETWCRIPCFATYNGLLYSGTSTCHGRASAEPDENVGKVFSFEAGKCVSNDDDIGTEWTHIAAVREQNVLRLYINGELVSEKSDLGENDFNLSNDLPLLIGAGEHHYYKGAIDDLRLYNSALSQEDIQAILK